MNLRLQPPIPRNPVAQVTPSVLSWARERSGYSIDAIVAAFKQKTVTAETVMLWEEGKKRPTYSQLEMLAEKYKRPLALFFFPSPPTESGEELFFRSLPASLADRIPPEIRYLVRKAKVRQMDLAELFVNGNNTAKVYGLSRRKGESAFALAQRVRDAIGISIQKQKKATSLSIALKMWREAIERLGIWVFKDSFKDENYCGFCLYDERFPVIYVNNSQVLARQIFTLFHELGHLLMRRAGVDFRSSPAVGGKYGHEEEFCDSFAGNFLMPSEQINALQGPFDDERIKRLAHMYSVSYEVVLRRLFNEKRIKDKEYKARLQNWRAQAISAATQKKPKKGGGSFYLTQCAYLGDSYLQLVFGRYYNDSINRKQLADYLGVKEGQIDGIEGAWK